MKGCVSMKKLICAEDIEEIVIKQGQKKLCVEMGTILTPSAKDAAKAAKLEIYFGKPDSVDTPCEEPSCDEEISSELIYSALKVMESKGLLDEFRDECLKAILR